MVVSSGQSRATLLVALVGGGLQAGALMRDGKMANQLAQIGLVSRSEAASITAMAQSAVTDIPGRMGLGFAVNKIGGGRPVADAVELGVESTDAQAVRKTGSAALLREAKGLKKTLASMLGADLTKAIAHNTGNVQIVYKGMRMNVPVGMDAADVAKAVRRYENDPVGDLLQEVTAEVSSGWSLNKMSSRAQLHYKDLIDGAKSGDVPWWKVRRFEMQRKGAWVEDMVLNDPRISTLGITGKSTGVDITHNGLRYDIMSGTESNFVTHATRQGMSDIVFRMISFGSKGP